MVVDLAVEDEPATASSFVIGCIAVSERSMIARRRKPSPTRPSSATQVSAPSGPRCASVSRIRVTSRSSTGEEDGSKLSAPAMPHMLAGSSSAVCGAGTRSRARRRRARPRGRPRAGSRRRASLSARRPGISAIGAGSSPSSMFVPSSIVTGRSVESRSVKQGTPRAEVSSWMPPESVRTKRARRLRDRRRRGSRAARRELQAGSVDAGRGPCAGDPCARPRVDGEDERALAASSTSADRSSRAGGRRRRRAPGGGASRAP